MSKVMNDIFYNHFCKCISDDNERVGFFAKQVGDVMAGMHLEQMIFNTASRLADNYKGGMWDFATVGSTFFVHLSKKKTFTAKGFLESYEVDGRIFGLVVTLSALSHASFIFASGGNEGVSEKVAEHYHALRNAFYQAVDELAHYSEVGVSRHPDITDEEIEQIKQMGSVVYRILD